MGIITVVPLSERQQQPAGADRQTERRCDFDPISGLEFNCRYVVVAHTHPTSTPTTVPTTLPCGINGPRTGDHCTDIDNQLITGTTTAPVTPTTTTTTPPRRCDDDAGVHSHNSGRTCHADHQPCRDGQHRDNGHDSRCHSDHVTVCTAGTGAHRHRTSNTCHPNHPVPITCGTQYRGHIGGDRHGNLTTPAGHRHPAFGSKPAFCGADHPVPTTCGTTYAIHAANGHDHTTATTAACQPDCDNRTHPDHDTTDPTDCHADHTVPDTCGTTYTGHRTGGGSQGATQHIDYTTPLCPPPLLCDENDDDIQIRAARPEGATQEQWIAALEKMRTASEQAINAGICDDDRGAAELLFDWMTPDLYIPIEGLCLAGGLVLETGANYYTAGSYSIAGGTRVTLFLIANCTRLDGNARSAESQPATSMPIEIEIEIVLSDAVDTEDGAESTPTASPTAPAATTTTEAVASLSVQTCVRLRDGRAEFAWALPTGAAEPVQWSMHLDMGGLPLPQGTWPGSKRTHSLNLGTSLIEYYAGQTWTFSIDASPQTSPLLSGSSTGTVGNDWAGDTGVGQC